MAEKKVAKKREPKVTKLTRLMMRDPDVRDACRAVVARTNTYSLGDLAAKQPRAFDALYDAMMDLAEQDPHQNRPRFLT